MFAICNNLGLLPEQFFPTGRGRDYAPSPYLKLLQEHRNDFTVFSGVSHPNVDGGHPSDICFLTAAPHPASSSFRNTISLDQYIAERIGTLTRFPSLTLAVNARPRSLSWTGTGVAIPPEEKAADVFKQLFLQGTPEEVEAQIREARHAAAASSTPSPTRRRTCSAMSARATATGSINTSPACAISSSACRRRAGGRRKPKPVVNVAAAGRSGQPARNTWTR